MLEIISAAYIFFIQSKSKQLKSIAMYKKVLTIDDAVVFLNDLGYPVTKSTLYENTMKKTIPFQRFGKRKLVFSPDDLSNWAEAQLTKITNVDVTLK